MLRIISEQAILWLLLHTEYASVLSTKQMQQMWVSTVVFQECFLYSSAADYGRVRSCVQRGDQHDCRRGGGGGHSTVPSSNPEIKQLKLRLEDIEAPRFLPLPFRSLLSICIICNGTQNTQKVLCQL